MNAVTKNQSDNVSYITKMNNTLTFPIRYVIFLLRTFAYYLLYKYGLIQKPPVPETITKRSTDYIEIQTTKFLNSYKTPSQEQYNINIEKCFYDTKQHSLEVEDANNELEKTWKRRIMFESTPRGNIIMHYDAFKQGFVYYSDNSNIPYFLMNAVVMKYVLLYRCRDFFIDNQITPENAHSPLLNEREKTNQSEQDTSITKSGEKSALKSSAFAKLKNYNTVSGKLSQNTEKETSKSNENKYTRNKIIHVGKISNFSFLQKPKVTKHVGFSSDLLDGLKANSDAQNRVFSYKDFKKLKNKQINNSVEQENNV